MLTAPLYGLVRTQSSVTTMSYEQATLILVSVTDVRLRVSAFLFSGA